MTLLLWARYLLLVLLAGVAASLVWIEMSRSPRR
jgi:hypothetical protein